MGLRHLHPFYPTSLSIPTGRRPVAASDAVRETRFQRHDATYGKFSHTPISCFSVVPYFDHWYRSGSVEDDKDAIDLIKNQWWSSLEWNRIRTIFGKIGAIQQCAPSTSSFSPSINFSGVRTSSFVPGLRSLTLWGYAEISAGKNCVKGMFSFQKRTAYCVQLSQCIHRVRHRTPNHSIRRSRHHHVSNAVETHK